MFILFVSLFFIWFESQSIPLFDYYPDLKNNIGYLEELTNLPTPVQLVSNFNNCSLSIKRDDLTALNNRYGGNKCRKLAFILADALQKKAECVITLGATGSNHCVATACHCNALNIPCKVFVKDQPNSDVVQQNLKLCAFYGADIIFCNSHDERKEKIDTFIKDNANTYLIPTGGSTALGALGYVDAALELKKQIDNNVIPEPDIIVLPIGSCGTTAGLLLGLQLANITSKIVAVATFPDGVEYFDKTVKKLFAETNILLNSISPSIPLFDFPESQFIIDTRYCGSQYGMPTQESEYALEYMKQNFSINLENTYSAKACASALNFCEHPHTQKVHVLFWNTYCGLDFFASTATVDYTTLPKEVHHYFE